MPSLTTQQVADRLVCSIRTVGRLARSGDLTPVDTTRRPWLFDAAEVEALRSARYDEASQLAAALRPARTRRAS